ncbi:glycosyltransferase family protein [Kocuria palustris]|uniref:glycosyltransferase family protein n=1 Tax=Kocuria palustris TaxID=71999 RepID=UPI003D7549A7
MSAAKPSLPSMPTASDLRTMLWHLRQGGPTQLRKHLRRRSLPSGSSVASSGGRGLSFRPTEWPQDWDRAFAGITVATILDDFSSRAFSYEWDQIPLTRQGWREQLEQHRPQLLFVESAWHGNDDQWQYQLTGTSGVKEPFRELVAEFRAQGIPTVFWNKEDPPHYDDFLECAGLFDIVLTSDSNRVEHYRRDLGHDRVGVLAFAAQPAVHSPVRPARGVDARDVAFGGMYFAHKFPERREQMDLLLGGAADVSPKMPRGLEIFSRYLGDDERYQFPAPLDRRVVGSLDYAQMLTAYQAYKVFLNVNSVVDSPSMCARRVFEILSRGTAVVSTPSAAVGEYFPQAELPVVETREQAADVVRALVRSKQLRDRTVRRAQRRVWAEHTYTHRAASVLDLALPRQEGSWQPSTPSVSAILATNRPAHLGQAFDSVAAQRGVELELVLVCHGFEPDAARAREQAAERGLDGLVIVAAAAEWSLGACLNAGVDAASGDVVAKMDDDDWYGPDYLADQLAMLRVTQADVVGKQASYLYVQSYDATLLRFGEREHRWTDFVLGPTLMARRSVFQAHPFRDRTTGEDTGFLQDVVDGGGRVYATDRFNFRQFRGGHGHTWNVTDQHVISTGEVMFFGQDTTHLCV